MTMRTRIRSVIRSAKYKAQETTGRAKQRAGRATGNNRLRRQGKAEELRSRFSQAAKKIQNAVRR
jgi:uncharacterized protein YjbJ (UPF0337 family)